MEEESWRRDHGPEIVEETRGEKVMLKSGRRNHGGLIKEDSSNRREHLRDIWRTSASHLGGLWEASGDTWKAPGVSPGCPRLSGRHLGS
jgi:hypothetical protein